MRSSRYAQLDGDAFYRGVVDAAHDGPALVFASPKQLQVLQTGSDVYFDATFKVVPGLYYQLLTVFVHARHGSADKRSQHQMPEEEDV